MQFQPPPSLLIVPAIAWGASACSLQAAPPADESERATYASVRVERNEASSEHAAIVGLPRADALAGFVRVPTLVDPVMVSEAVGLSKELPDLGSCETRTSIASGGPLSETTQVEFIDAGSVRLSVNENSTLLAPYAFPTVTDSMSGVLYSTRDRAAEPLPAAQSYTLEADGLELRTQVAAPSGLSGITLGGLPLADVRNVPAERPLDLTWNVGAPGDLVYAELSQLGGSERVWCTFADDVGAGSVPASIVSLGSELELSLHRLRVHDFESPMVEGGRLYFDFQVSHRIIVR